MAKKIIIAISLLAAAYAVTGCERADYQHPLHRSN
jgi:predicted small secreted protein